MSLDLKVLFWNTYKNADINYVIAELVAENNISIVVLAEYIAEIDDLLKILLLQYGLKMRLYDNCCDRITIIGKIKDVEMRFDSGIRCRQNRFRLHTRPDWRDGYSQLSLRSSPVGLLDL